MRLEIDRPDPKLALEVRLVTHDGFERRLGLLAGQIPVLDVLGACARDATQDHDVRLGRQRRER